MVQVRARNLTAPCSTCLGTCGPFARGEDLVMYYNVLPLPSFPQQSSGLLEGWIQVRFFLAVKKLGILFQNHFIANNTLNFEISVHTIMQKIKMLGPFRRREKHPEFFSDTNKRKKNCWKLVLNHSMTKKNTQITLF